MITNPHANPSNLGGFIQASFDGKRVAIRWGWNGEDFARDVYFSDGAVETRVQEVLNNALRQITNRYAAQRLQKRPPAATGY